MANRKKILIFSLAYYPVVGGAEVAIKEITDRIPECDFDLITLRFDKSHPKQEKLGNVTVYRISNSSYLGKILFVPLSALWAMRRKHDVYWAMMSYMSFPVVLMRLCGNRTPYVLTLQDGDPFEQVFRRWFIIPFLPLLKYGFRHASVIQPISNFLAGWSRKLGYKGRVELVPNGVNIAKFAKPTSPAHGEALGNSREKSVWLITTSRLVEKNGVGDIIQALTYLSENFKLQIIGVGPLESDLRQMTNNLQLQNRVEFVGFKTLDEIPSYLHKADIFVRPSLSEGQGISFLEGMASGLPVIATNVGGIPDFIKDGETGVFCKVRNPESLAEQVQRIMGDTSLRERLVENGQKLVREKYEWDLIAREMRDRVFYTI